MPGSAQTPTLKLACFSAASATSSSERDCGGFVFRLLRRGRGRIERKGKAVRARRNVERSRSGRRLALRCSSTTGADSEGARSRSMEVNSSSVKSSRQASRSGGCVSIAARSSASGTWQSMVTSSLDKQDGVPVLLQRLAIALALDLGWRGRARPPRCRIPESAPRCPCRRCRARRECYPPHRRAGPSHPRPSPAARPASRSPWRDRESGCPSAG